MSTSRYARELGLTELDNAHTLGVLLTPPGSRVLDVGIGDGDPVARELHARGCRIWGIELDQQAAAAAAEFTERVVIGDVEKLDLEAELGDVRFDVVLCLDVLEHLVDPGAALARVAALLDEHGVLVASIPNVTHAAVKLQLLKGNFTYTETGLLDRTHVRFFDRAEVERLFATAGLPVHELLRVEKPVDGTEISVDLTAFSSEVVAEALAADESRTYQFIVVAGRPGTPSRRPEGGGTLLERMQQALRTAERVVADAASYARELEESIRAKDTQAAEVEQFVRDLQARVDELEDALRERMAEIHAEHDALVALRADLRVKEEYIAELAGLPRPAAAKLLTQRARRKHQVRVVLRRVPGLLPLVRWGRGRRAARRPPA